MYNSLPSLGGKRLFSLVYGLVECDVSFDNQVSLATLDTLGRLYCTKRNSKEVGAKEEHSLVSFFARLKTIGV